MSHRFFSPTPLPPEVTTPSEVRLDGTEAHHFLHVLRGGVGDRLTLFDGSGREFQARVASVTRREVVATLISSEIVDRETTVSLTLGVAMPKGDRQKMLVEKLTELGVTRLVPLNTERSVASLKESAIEKLRRGVVEASKQCGRNLLMQIDQPTQLSDFLNTTAADKKLLAHPYDGTPPATVGAATIAIAVGPEGGFSDVEVAAANAAGWERLTLGRSVLRVETAAIATAALASFS